MSALVILGILLFASLLLAGTVLYYGQSQNPKDPDEKLLVQLQKAGADFVKPHVIHFHIFFTGEEGARKAAAEAEALGCSCEVKRAPHPTDWACIATKTMTPQEKELKALRTRFKDMARRFEGRYDGWGTEVRR